jgi:uncharacterized repeat protein (TIGR03803 family)
MIVARLVGLAVSVVALCGAMPGGAWATTLKTLFAFPGGGDGLAPATGLVKIGKLVYGTTPYGGAAGRGTVFTVDPATGKESIVYSFAGGKDGAYPMASVIGVGGTIYGTASAGGAAGLGTVFAINASTGTETTLFSFTTASGSTPLAALISADGALWGTASAGGSGGYGTVFKLDPATGAETTVYAFTNGNDGANPYAALVNLKGTLYGTALRGGAYACGAVFAINPRKGTETNVYSFTGGDDGTWPSAPLIIIGNLLYGTASLGGAQQVGTIFSLNPASGAETTIYTFTLGNDGGVPEAPLINIGGILYGTTAYGGADFYGTVFRVDLSSGTETTLYTFPGGSQGASPPAGLLQAGGILLGTSPGTGINGYNGSIFSINLATGVETTLHSFFGSTPQFESNSALIEDGTNFYGTTAEGGDSDAGSVFQIDASGKGRLLHSFTGGDDGANPSGALVKVGKLLYGATAQGGPSQGGTIFAIDPITGNETQIYAFTGGTDGGSPNGGLLDVGGMLYGTTISGGASGDGTIFAINPATGALTTLYAFLGQADGFGPTAGLIERHGVLYGTTKYGGYDYGSQGTVFSFNPATGVETVLYTFTGDADGGWPSAALTLAGDQLYGTAQVGGNGGPIACTEGYDAGCGVVFRIDPATGAETVLYNFKNDVNGAYPTAALVAVGKTLYGATTAGGAGGLGTLFALDPKTATLQTLYGFTGAGDGGVPRAALLNAGGILYGATSFGGKTNSGTVFTLSP